MANDYFNHDTSLYARGQLARATTVNTSFSGVTTGLDKLPSELPLKQDRVTYAADTGAADAYVVALAAAPTAYTAGLRISFKATNANTGASTINVNGLGAKSIKRQNGTDLGAAEIGANNIVLIQYDGTNFLLLSGATYGSVGTVAIPVPVASGGTAAATAAAARTNLGLVIGTDVQAYDAQLAAVAALAPAADEGLYFTSGTAAATFSLTAAGRALMDDATAAAQATTLGLGTLDSPQFAGVNIGHATDTTITRASAGDIAVEGNAIYRAGGTDVPIADGGTGSSTAATAATALGLGTGDSPQFAGINVGHATDTTITRTGAGDVAVEGKAIYRADGTDVPVADGGTGSSTAAAARSALAVAGLADANSFTGPNTGSVTTLTDGATITMNLSTTNNFKVTLGGNRNIDVTNISEGLSGMLYVKQGTAGALTLTFRSGFDTAISITLATAASAVNLVAFYCYDSATVWAVKSK